MQNCNCPSPDPCPPPPRRERVRDAAGAVRRERRVSEPLGSYACRCRAGFQDRSRLGSGGTLCVGPAGTGPSQPRPGPGPALLHFLYGLCFLLAALVLVLLGVVGALYRRHHRGAFPVPCYARHSAGSAASPRNGAARPPPPPPPVRRPKDGWGGPQDKCPSADLPLLKFAPLPPPDAPQSGEQEGGDRL
ncbi:hypothetical protein COCON_G00039360 [Conger conger]|uniref:Uncharacterized protein n=1 Tax=Conger conger TaxID=82655 RepID=A0A9Q1E089_CONCO|nr:hypothetical protein COCON_G00039360 [Conger conger]